MPTPPQSAAQPDHSDRLLSFADKGAPARERIPVDKPYVRDDTQQTAIASGELMLFRSKQSRQTITTRSTSGREESITRSMHVFHSLAHNVFIPSSFPTSTV